MMATTPSQSSLPAMPKQQRTLNSVFKTNLKTEFEHFGGWDSSIADFKHLLRSAAPHLYSKGGMGRPTRASWKKSPPPVVTPFGPSTQPPPVRDFSKSTPAGERVPLSKAVNPLSNPPGSLQENVGPYKMAGGFNPAPTQSTMGVGRKTGLSMKLAGQYHTKALHAGVNPKDVHMLAKDIHQQDTAQKAEVGDALNRAREQAIAKGWGDAASMRKIRAAESRGEIDYSHLDGFDEMAEEFGQRYPDLVKYDNPEKTLFELLMIKGNPKPKTHEQAYEEALNHLLAQKGPVQREPGEDAGESHSGRRRHPDEEEIPFWRESPLHFDMPLQQGDYRGLLTPELEHVSINRMGKLDFWHSGSVGHEEALRKVAPNLGDISVQEAIEKHGFSRIEVGDWYKHLNIETHHERLPRIKRWVRGNVDPQHFEQVHITTFGHPDKQPRTHIMGLSPEHFSRESPLHFISTDTGHFQDAAEPKVKIDQVLWASIQRLVPSGWYAWAQACMDLRRKYGVPESLPFYMGEVQGATGEPLKVELRDGDEIMVDHDADFTEGANGYEDEQLCGKDTVVLDSNILFPKPLDLTFNCYHESAEGQGDGDGKCIAAGLEYDDAHVYSNAKEMKLRRQARAMRVPAPRVVLTEYARDPRALAFFARHCTRAAGRGQSHIKA